MKYAYCGQEGEGLTQKKGDHLTEAKVKVWAVELGDLDP